MTVTVIEEDIILPTYSIGQPEKNPMFFEKRVYQGSSGVVYPYQVVENISDTCQDKKYHAIYLENEYIKVMILPELGGRVQQAYDKIKKRNFIYYNQVVKPALVGLTGPWISGGIEFNWPQHHRPSTFLPVDYTIEHCTDGSAIVWVSERERMFHQKGMAGFTLRPGHAVLEIQGRLFNPTPVPQTFLWWANPAVAVNDEYQSVFPADVNAVFDHGKRDVSKYPIATGTYYKMDYSAGVDISRYKNIPVPTSYMAIRSTYNFVGGYENDTQAGLLHVANHHISPGKKQWTWGNGDFGKAWDRNLTDADGPYIELMTGVFTDNQPDFTWLQPYEEKMFTQYFMPYRELGVVKNACSDLLMNIEQDAAASIIKLFATRAQKDLHVIIISHDKTVFDQIIDLSPEIVFTHTINNLMANEAEICVYRSSGKLLLTWKADPINNSIPEPAKSALMPQEVSSVEQLYLTGLHLEQYRHATYNATDYYLEGLRRDDSDIRCNNAMGLWFIRRAKYQEAEIYLRKAVSTLTQRNPNPYEGEPYYNLGLALIYQGFKQQAYDAFYKACWNAAWQGPGYFALAQISVDRGELEDALYEVNQSLIRNWHNHRARHLKTMILRKLGHKDEAMKLIDESLKIDKFNFGCVFEKLLLKGESEMSQELREMMRNESRNYEELATDYAQAGNWDDALTLVLIAFTNITKPSPMLHYFQSWFYYKMGQLVEAEQAALKAEQCSFNDFFPNTLDAMSALQCVITLSIRTPKALYLLGNIWYDKRQYHEAINAWECSKELDSSFPTVLRNLSLAYYNKLNKRDEALLLLENAYSLDTSDSRVLMELDQLHKNMNHSPKSRLEFLDEHIDIVQLRDDLYLEYINLLNLIGNYEKALQMIDNHHFHPWEGGEGKVPAQYQQARLGLVLRYITTGDYEQALTLIDQCFNYPIHLGEGKLHGALENDFFYYKGCILKAMGNNKEANKLFMKAGTGSYEIATMQYYNDQKPDKIYFQGLSLLKLDRVEEAKKRFEALIQFGEKHVNDTFVMDYFAVSLPDLQIWEKDMNQINEILCNYLIGLGYAGLNDKEKAKHHLKIVIELDKSYQFTGIVDTDGNLLKI